MSAQVLTRDEVAALESTIDQAYASTPPPASTYYRAAWILLSFSEDVFRSAIHAQTFLNLRDSLPVELRSGDHLNLKISDQIDKTKFALHQALNLLRKTLKPETDRIDYTFRSGDEPAALSAAATNRPLPRRSFFRKLSNMQKRIGSSRATTRASRAPSGIPTAASNLPNRLKSGPTAFLKPSAGANGGARRVAIEGYAQSIFSYKH
jgi:hypothetical protein